MSRAPNKFAYLLALGVVLWTTIQALINIGVATGALPTKGIALPLISSGGSGLVLTAAALGLLLSVGCRSPELSNPSPLGEGAAPAAGEGLRPGALPFAGQST
jgi:cell division protein FtsW (lipid II flippase)